MEQFDLFLNGRYDNMQTEVFCLHELATFKQHLHARHELPCMRDSPCVDTCCVHVLLCYSTGQVVYMSTSVMYMCWCLCVCV